MLGAKNITVDVRNGGISYIRVIDDGSGIMKDDMEIAFERHATSKIRKAEDLENVKSMGFRGEALASIAAISKIELVSKTKESKMGYKVVFEGGDLIDKHEEGTSNGTSITIKDLFYNTPVRYKFLKKDFTELGYIEDAVTRIALANPSVAIKLINSGKTIIQTNGSGKLEDAIYAIFGKETAQNILPVDYIYEDMHVTGVIGKPIISRSNRTNQLFFVNHRYIKDKTLTSAAEQGFKGLVTVGKHGFLILNIDMDAKGVDVNVHPTKLEVRFKEESKVFKAVYHSIKETLLKGDLVSDPDKDYEDYTPNDMLKEIKNKDRIEAWGLNKTFEASKAKQEEKNSDKSANENAGLKFSDFKDTIKGLDESTRTKFVQEIAKATTAEEISKGLNKFTAFMKNMELEKDANNEKSEVEEKVENEKTNDEEKIVKEDVEKQPKTDLEKEKQEDLTENKSDENKENNEENKKEEENYQIIETENTEKQDDNESKEPENSEDKEENKSEENNKQPNVENEKESAEDTENKIQDNENELEEKDQELSFEEMYKKLFGRDIESAKKEYKAQIAEEEENSPISPIKDNEISIFENNGKENDMPYKFIGIAFNTYIILSINNDLYILDQHAAHERIMYEKVKKNYFSKTEKDSQIMLLPDIINLNNKEMGIFKDNKELFEKAGFIVEEFGDNTIKLTGVPEFCIDFDTKEIFLETLDEINTVARTAKQELEDKFLATVACKAAVKAHMALTKQEVDSLMEELLKLPNPFSCPHGRPTVIKMSKTDIEKKFSRR